VRSRRPDELGGCATIGRECDTATMTTSDSPTIKNHAAFIWSVADLLRGDYKQSEYGKVILPLTVQRQNYVVGR